MSKKFSQFNPGSIPESNIILVGLQGGDNFQMPLDEVINAFEVVPDNSKTLSAYSRNYLFTGNDGTWVMPDVSENENMVIRIKHKGTGSLTLQGGMFDSAETSEIVMFAGTSITFINDGSHWTQV